MTEILKAAVQYGDFEGTSSADEGHEMIRNLLEKDGLIQKSEVLIGVRFFVGENHGGPSGPAYVRFLIADGEGFNNIGDQLDNQAPLILREVEREMALPDLFGLFKRFAAVLTLSDTNLIGREYEIKQ